MSDTKELLLKALAREIQDQRVLEALRRVSREDFVAAVHRHLAYADIALPISDGQTISQPFVVALMSQEAEILPENRVLEVGTGSGYQAAVLAELAAFIVSVERLPRLAEEARRLLGDFGYSNVQVHLAGDELGWAAQAPYDAILVTAAAPRIPPSLLDQLAEGGRLVIPVGTRADQELLLVKKVDGRPVVRTRGPFRFVPLVGREAWPEGTH